MSNSEKLLKTLSSLVENGILTSKDIQKEISTDLKFTRDKLINKFQLVSREEFEVLKKMVRKQELAIKKVSYLLKDESTCNRQSVGKPYAEKINAYFGLKSFAYS